MLVPLCCSLLGYWQLFLLRKSPLLINPFYVTDRIEIQSIPGSTLIMMAVLLPIVALTLLVVLVVVVVYVFVVFTNERKHLVVIDKLMSKE